MIDIRVFIRAAIVGIVLQVALMVAAHFILFIEQQGFLLGGMTISAVAGYLYAMDTGKGYFTSATMAAIIGGGSVGNIQSDAGALATINVLTYV